MGTLHNIQQITPLIINGGAFIKIKAPAAADFESQYTAYLEQHFSDAILPQHTSLQQATTDLTLTGMYVCKQLIPVETAGLFLFVESSGKHGYEQNFIDLLQHFSASFEDALFYITWDNLVDEFKIENGVLNYQREKDNKYDFVAYFEKKHPSQTDWLQGLYINEAQELKRAHERTLADGESIKEWFDRAEYQEAIALLDKALKIDATDEIVMALKAWMQVELKALS